MNEENKVLGRVLKSLRDTLPTGFSLLLKHNDAITQGVPDFSLSVLTHTSWWEAKFSENFKLVHPRPVQHERLLDLERARVLSRYLVWDKTTEMVLAVVPSKIAADWSFNPEEAESKFYQTRSLVSQTVALVAYVHRKWKQDAAH